MSAQRSGPRLVAFGECMLELQGEAFGAMSQGFGGDTLNTAVYAARCGAGGGLRVAYASAVGDDALSAGLLGGWRAAGIDTSLVRRLPGRLPGLYLIEVDSSGERRFYYWRNEAAARAYFSGAPTGSTPLEQAVDQIDALYFSGISLAILPPAGRRRLLSLARKLKRRGSMVAFDNNYRPRLWPSLEEARQAFSAALAQSTLALMTFDDEQALWGEPNAQRQLQRTWAWPCPELVIKRGAAATLVRSGANAPVEVPTLPVEHVVDTTAAGDSFAGAYLACRLAGGSAVQAAAAGNRLAARVVQHRGAILPVAAMQDLIDG